MGELTLVQALLAINTMLTLIAAFFISNFVKDVQSLTKDVVKLKLNVALLAQHVKLDIKQFSED